MNFGVSGQNIGWSNLAIYRNPVTQAAVARQREKERLARDIASYGRRVETAKRISQQNATDLACKEERFRREFLYDITKRRMAADEERMQQLRQSQREVEYSAKAKLTARDIIYHHVDNSPFTYGDITSACRQRSLVAVRQAAMADVYVKCPHLSLPQIGKMFGGRDHTTVLHAVQKLGVHRPHRSDKTPDYDQLAA